MARKLVFMGLNWRISLGPGSKFTGIFATSFRHCLIGDTAKYLQGIERRDIPVCYCIDQVLQDGPQNSRWTMFSQARPLTHRFFPPPHGWRNPPLLVPKSLGRVSHCRISDYATAREKKVAEAVVGMVFDYDVVGFVCQAPSRASPVFCAKQYRHKALHGGRSLDCDNIRQSKK